MTCTESMAGDAHRIDAVSFENACDELIKNWAFWTKKIEEHALIQVRKIWLESKCMSIELDTSDVIQGEDGEVLECVEGYDLQFIISLEPSYEVPVFHVIGQNINGVPISEKKMCSIMPSHLVEQIQAKIIQVETINGKIGFGLHPCCTGKLLKLTNPKNAYEYLLTWLSVVAPLFHLKVPLELFS